MLQNALSNERDVINKIYHGFGREQYGYRFRSSALQPPGGSSIAMFKNTPFQGQWPCWKDTLVTGDFPMVLQIFDIESKLRNSLIVLIVWNDNPLQPCQWLGLLHFTIKNSPQAFQDPVYQAQCLVKLLRHRDLEDQKFSRMEMGSLRALGNAYKIKAKSRESLKNLMVHRSCHILNFCHTHFLIVPLYSTSCA